ncbi:glycoside hydrolase family 16 protein [Pontixanthobacter aestiaquae]|uniref:Family 16 glycosylhydrolase n=1 Tax=Pontixanthobacter aestiaquae TaxID=1509367 RepID=A0A844Z2T0_9SPHN|nr:glycoside hydrolase family 16 protein [Pontixanthobacter aestiaquae]MDN3647230.1 glycoside hydrolase family 16 protein [Pontixanthobacter aestiaquae]MXO81794.1 family 16 glycosylhydrolase [Pontixanthobacter aestiaquae]
MTLFSFIAAAAAATQLVHAEASQTAQTTAVGSPQHNTPAREPHRPPQGYELVFADEFDSGSMPDPEKWGYDTHRNTVGWYNNELQYYASARPENVRLENGNLVLEARKEVLDRGAFPDWGEQEYTSTRLFTQGKAAWTYGFYEIRAKLPCGRGTWPAIWMLPEDPDVVWPNGGEIDIMEHVGFEPGVIHNSVHTKAFNWGRGTQRTASFRADSVCGQFHRYQLLWTPKILLFGFDDQPKFLFEKKSSGNARWPFDKNMHLLLNIAIGGDWGGRKGIDNDALPARMEIDHVRVYQLKSKDE